MNIDYLRWVEHSTERKATHQIYFPAYENTKQKYFSKILLRMQRVCILILVPAKIGKTRLAMVIEKQSNSALADSCHIRRPLDSLMFRKGGERGAFVKRFELSKADEAVPHINGNSESEKESFEIIGCVKSRKMGILESNKL